MSGVTFLRWVGTHTLRRWRGQRTYTVRRISFVAIYKFCVDKRWDSRSKVISFAFTFSYLRHQKWSIVNIFFRPISCAAFLYITHNASHLSFEFWELAAQPAQPSETVPVLFLLNPLSFTKAWNSATFSVRCWILSPTCSHCLSRNYLVWKWDSGKAAASNRNVENFFQ